MAKEQSIRHDATPSTSANKDNVIVELATNALVVDDEQDKDDEPQTQRVLYSNPNFKPNRRGGRSQPKRKYSRPKKIVKRPTRKTNGKYSRPKKIVKRPTRKNNGSSNNRPKCKNCGSNANRPNRQYSQQQQQKQNSRPARTQNAAASSSTKDFTPRTNYDAGSTGSSSYDKLWLQAHNKRRKSWHTSYGVSYVPLQWSTILEKESQDWAEHLLSTCGGPVVHDGRTPYGENLASNFGSGRDGEARSPEELLIRWVDREANKDPPNNLHLSQVLWRSSQYVGCGMASRKYGSGGMCHTQVCRYARPGNCAMGQYNNWQTPTFADDSRCTPAEPIAR
jgi:hypothetical protein